MPLESVAGARIRFAPALATCPVCQRKLLVYKTEIRTVVTLAYGSFQAQEVLLCCPGGCQGEDGGQSVKVHRSEILAQLVAPGHVYGFDVVAKVGLLRFLECRHHQEIRAESKRTYGLWIPESTVGDLIHQFVDLMRALHEDKVAALRRSLEAAGGYALHVDGTCEEGTYRTPEEVRQAEEALERLKGELRRENDSDPTPAQRTAIRIVLSHLEKYWDGLFGHFLPLPDAERYLVVQRTNNLAERFFRSVKRFCRRITGKRRLHREVDAFSDQMGPYPFPIVAAPSCGRAWRRFAPEDHDWTPTPP